MLVLAFVPPAQAQGLGRPGALKPGAAAANKRAAQADPDPPGDAGPLPTNMEKIAQATDVPYRPKPPGHKVKFNLQDADLAELVNHISGLTGRRFIYGAKVRQIKATVVAPQPVTLEEAYQAFLSILEVNGMTVVPHGRFLKIVDSAGVQTKATQVLPRGAPVPAEDRFVTRLYRLEHVTAEEVVQVLNKFKSKEGDISLYGPGRLLIITDTGAQVRRMIRLIEEIDVGGAGQGMWIEPIHYVGASDMAKRITELFGLEKGPAGGLTKVIADEATNTMIVVGTEDGYLKLIEVLKRLDSAPSEQGRVHVLPLQHAVAEELAKTLSQMLGSTTGRRAQQGKQAPAGTPEDMFEGAVRVTADQSTNSLIITSTARDYAQLRLVIDKLDQPRRQVFIEAVIMDISVSDATTLGVSWHGAGTADLGGDTDSLLVGGFDPVNSLAFPNLSNLDALQGVAAGVRGPEVPGAEDLTPLGISIPAFGVVLQALASSGKSNVLATPHIIATDNVTAEIRIGENIPLQTNVGGGLGNAAQLLAGQQQGAAGAGLPNLAGLGLGLGFGAAPRQDVGNHIKVTPHINESNQVRLEIEQESSSPGAAAGALGAVSITQRRANTTVVVQDQETVVIGGLMREENVTTSTKVPVLGDLPVLGFLFRRSTNEKRKANLLLILTPHVIREQSDLRRIFERKMRERQEFLDRYFVFSSDTWEPPRDYSRSNGLVEDVRQAFFQVEEQIRLEKESMPTEARIHEPTAAIEMPQVQTAAPVKAAPAAPKAVPKAAPKPPARPKRAPAKPGTDASPLQINPVARSVNVERLEQ